MGADVSLALYGGHQDDLAAAVAEIEKTEKLFSIYDPTSELSRLNKQGGGAISYETAQILSLCDRLHSLTGGLFDPTIQPIFKAALKGSPLPWHLVGWKKLHLTRDQLHLAPGQQMTLNGIAQGYATDKVKDLLIARGYDKALVSVGEHAAIGGPFRLGLVDPEQGQVGTRVLENSAVATSSPLAMKMGRNPHIFHPKGDRSPSWSTVSVQADSAALADGLSTALCLAQLDQIKAINRATGARITMVDAEGDISTIG
ncbi:MAG: FAD:protein FMN transferase [Pseudomonadota bacterium]